MLPPPQVRPALRRMFPRRLKRGHFQPPPGQRHLHLLRLRQRQRLLAAAKLLLPPRLLAALPGVEVAALTPAG